MKRQKSVTTTMIEKPNQSTVDESVQAKKEQVIRNAYAERRLAFEEGKIPDEFVREFDKIEKEYKSEFAEIRAHTAKKFVDKGIEILEKTGMALGRIKNIVIAYGCDLGWDVETIGHQWPTNYKDPKKIKGGKARAKQRYFARLQKENPDKLKKDAEKGGLTRSEDTEEMGKIGDMSARSRTTTAALETLAHQTTVYCPFDIVFNSAELKQMVDKKEVWVRILDHDRHEILRAIPA